MMRKRRIDNLVAFMFGLSILLFFGFTRDWTESTPTDSTVANQIDDFNRYLRVDTAERLEDYISGFNAGETATGFFHILFIENAASLSTPAANKGLLYGKLANSKCELFWMDEDGDEKQITSGGALLISAGDFEANSIDEDDIELDNDSYLMAANAAGDGDVNLIKAGTNDLATLPDSAEMASNAAPTEDEGIANKKYVDDQDASTEKVKAWAKIVAGASPSLTDSFNIASLSDGGTGIYTFVFTTNLSDANYCIVTGINHSAAAFVVVANQTTSGFNLRTFNSAGNATDSVGGLYVLCVE